MTAAEPRFNDYDEFAQVYARVSETNPYNALYELPAILAMAGDMQGMRVLDAGCGPGLHAARLIEHGAAVTGIDLSGPMLAVARKRLGPGVPLHQADLTQPLAFLPDGSFDLVLSSLVMHYLERWEPALRELRRVLAPRGRLVLSTVHRSRTCTRLAVATTSALRPRHLPEAESQPTVRDLLAHRAVTVMAGRPTGRPNPGPCPCARGAPRVA